MSQKPKLDKLNTGIKGLDDDLLMLFAIFEDKERLDCIKKAIADEGISTDEFSKIVPKSLINLSIVLTGSQFAYILGKTNKEAVDSVKKAKSLIEKHFANLFENENTQSVLNSKATREERKHAESITDERVMGIAHYFIWEDNPPELTPAVRVAFKNQKKKILLNTRFDWIDLGCMVENLSEIFLDLLEKGKPLAELGQLDLSDSQNVAEKIEETLVNLQKAKDLMPVYKAKTDSE